MIKLLEENRLSTGVELEGRLAGINGNRDGVQGNSFLEGVLITRGNIVEA